LPKSYAFIAFMPQWDFLNFIAEKAKCFPHFSVLMGANVTELLRDGPRVLGVRAESHEGTLEVRAPLTVAADGRHSTVREFTGLSLRDLGAPIDVLWFRVPCGDKKIEPVLAHVGAGRILVSFDRGDYYQCAYVIAKGAAEAVKARGIEAFRADVRAIVPELGEQLRALQSFDDVKLLTVMVNRLEEWSAPGVLCIGDAAHAMSPVGGVGINLAIQDAVASSNLLAEPLRRNRVTEDDLKRVQARRALPTLITQALQVQAHERVLGPALTRSDQDFGAPLIFRLATHSRSMRSLLGRVIGIGVRSEHVRTSEAGLIEG
ncbi:MAG TPA: FAD-dependent oxidoreductase, partial [Polyangiaceae bacterium]